MTVAFLLGAIRLPIGRVIEGEEQNRAQFVSLLQSMRDETPDTHYIHIGECDRLHQPVANPTIRYGVLNPLYRHLASPVSGQVRLVLQPNYFPHPMRGMDSVVETLWPKLIVPVMGGTFSFHRGHFHRFGANDRAFISQALSLPDDEDI